MKIQNVTDAAFGVYGRVLEEYDVEPLLKAMCHTPLPEDEVLYIASEEELEDVNI